MRDPHVFHRMSLIAFLAWIGLGADGLSSSAYGPDESFKALVESSHAWSASHGQPVRFTFLALFLVVATATTVFVISSAYSRVIEHFPTGGGGYLVATKLLGPHAGVVSGCALLVDYVLTITTSVAAGGDALFNLLPLSLHHLKLPSELVVLAALVLLNLRGVKESVTALMPIFLVFVVTHVILIVGGAFSHAGSAVEVGRQVARDAGQAASTVGAWGLFVVFLGAYSRGGGTYTGIEAVSNGLQIMREPRVVTAKRTMVYMAVSLAFTAGGILLCYLLFGVQPEPGRTMNGVLVRAFAGDFRPGNIPVGEAFVYLTLIAEGAVLFVAAQTGFIDGPRVMANMAVDSWLPHRFASLSDRLTTNDGVLLMGGAALALLVSTQGSIDQLVTMYSIDVLVTFSLTMAGMCRMWVKARADHRDWRRQLAIQALGLLLCVSILGGTIVQKFGQGAWLTLVITSAAIALCGVIHHHYARIARLVSSLDREFEDLPSHDHHGGEPRPELPTAVLLVNGYGSLGIHTLLSIQRTFPGHFGNVLFVSVAVIDSGVFKGAREVDRLRENVERDLQRYVTLARRLGWNAGHELGVGTDVVAEATRICLALARRYPRIFVFAGKLLWQRESWFQRILHNETPNQVQRRLQWKGLPMTVLPLRVPARQGGARPRARAG